MKEEFVKNLSEFIVKKDKKWLFIQSFLKIDIVCKISEKTLKWKWKTIAGDNVMIYY
jgi:hypothetical protein